MTWSTMARGRGRVVAFGVGLLALTTPVLAGAQDVITTSTVSYCSDPLAIVVDTFDVRYFPGNSSIAFDISAASITTGLNLEAGLSLNAYGINALNTTIDFCSVLSGVLCPLPTYSFIGSGVYTIPSNIVPDITNLAYTVPDIEAVITVELTDTSTNLVAACLQVSLSNSLTVGLPSVTWATAGFLLFTFFLALFVAIFPTAPPGTGLLFFLLSNHLQHTAYSGMISLNYPLVFRVWTANFAYAIGLIRSKSIAEAIDRLRSQTGGNGVTLTLDSESFISRLYSPYNEARAVTGSLASSLLVQAKSFVNQLITNVASVAQGTKSFATTTAGSVQAGDINSRYSVPVVTSNTTLLDPGLEAYVNKVGFPPENAYMTVFIFSIILLAISLAALGLVAGILFLLIRSLRWDRDHVRGRYTYWASASGVRMLIFVYPPLSLFTFWQWSLGKNDAWLPIFISVFAWLGCTLALMWIGWVTWKIVKREGREALEMYGGRAHKWNAAFDPFKRGRWWAMAPVLLFTLLKMAFIGFGQGNGKLQVVALIVLESLSLICLLVFRPYNRKRWNFLAITLSLMHLIVYGILIAFVYSVGVKPIPRAVLGFVCLAVQSLGVVLCFVWAVWTVVGLVKWRIKTPKDRRSVYETQPMMSSTTGGKTEEKPPVSHFAHHNRSGSGVGRPNEEMREREREREGSEVRGDDDEEEGRRGRVDRPVGRGMGGMGEEEGRTRSSVTLTGQGGDKSVSGHGGATGGKTMDV